MKFYYDVDNDESNPSDCFFTARDEREAVEKGKKLGALVIYREDWDITSFVLKPIWCDDGS